MLTREQIDIIFTEAHNADGSRGFRYIVARAIYAQALKDAAAACERVGDEYTERERFKCLEMRSDAETGAASCAAAILALGKE